MTNFEGHIAEDERRTDYAMEISDDNYMFQNYSISIKNLDENIYFTIRIVYAYKPEILHKQCNDKDFANDLILRG